MSEGFGGPRRVHIMPQGYETERVYESAKMDAADKVILLRHTEQSEPGETCFQEVVSELDGAGIEWDDDECDFFDLADAMETIGGQIQKYPEDTVKVNISTGSKITAIAGAIACMATDARLYYVKAGEYEGRTIAREVDDIIPLPTHPIGVPEEDYLDVLDWIRENSGEDESVKKKALVDYAWELPPLDRYNRSDQRNKYKPVNTEIINPLIENGFIRQRKAGQGKIIWLTDEGKEMFESYNRLLNRV